MNFTSCIGCGAEIINYGTEKNNLCDTCLDEREENQKMDDTIYDIDSLYDHMPQKKSKKR